MTDQQFVALREAARAMLQENGFNVLRASGQRAYEGIILYVTEVARPNDPVWQWYVLASEREHATFCSRWYAWQQEERHRLGLD
jgi:hypothetical protein